ncbi:Choline transport protein [Talaromyces pinophilus]|nr:Choline transport protein [Talaromyces pinophilus]
MEALQMRKWNPHSASREIGISRASKHRDEAQLARLGKREVLSRNFGSMAVLGFSTSILITWEAELTTFLQPLQNGGPAGAVYGFLIVWASLIATFITISEMVSMAPTTGGQYHWCSMLASWLTVVGWQATFATGCYLNGTMIQGLIVLTRPNYVPQTWHATLLYWAVVIFSVTINVVGGSLLPKFEGLILVLHILGFFAILIPLTYMSNYGSAKDIFGTWVNSGDWPLQGISTLVGLMGAVFAFAGGDAAVHMAEETKNAQKVIPISILLSLMLNGVMGFAILIATLFCIGNVQDALETRTGYPFMEIFYQGTNSIAGTCIMSTIIIIMGICAVTGVLATTSRQFWAFSRDRGVPGWLIWSKVSERTNIPVNSVILTAVVSCLLGLIPLGSPIAFNDLTSMSTSGLYLSYMICCILLLYRRCTGGISEMADYRSRNSSGILPEVDEHIINTVGAKLVWGPFHLKGIPGIVVNVIAIVYMLIAVFFSFWPPTVQVTAATMNYSAVGTAGVMILTVVYYVTRAKKIYKGPVIEL